MSKSLKTGSFVKRPFVPPGGRDFYKTIKIIDGKATYDAVAKAYDLEFVPIRKVV